MNKEVDEARSLASGRSWLEIDSVIYLSLVSLGLSGAEWIERLIQQGYRLDEGAKRLISTICWPTESGLAFQVGIMRATKFSDDERREQKILQAAQLGNMVPANLEIAGLLREMISDQDIQAMGLWWLKVMHPAVESSRKTLGIDRCGLGQWLTLSYGSRPDGTWGRDGGFVFLLNPEID